MNKQRIIGLCLLVCVLVLAGCGVRANAEVDQVFILRTGIAEGRMVFLGAGGVIDGQANPDLTVQAGQRVRIEVINGDGATHDLALPDLGLQTSLVMGKESATALTFTAANAGVYTYICTVAGHRQAGMEGRLVVER